MHHLRNNIVRIRGVLSMIGRKVPLTPLGVFVAGLLAWFAWRLGWQRQDRVILAIATIGLGWLTLAIVIVGSAAVHLMLGRSCESLAALGGEADEPLATGSRFGRYPLTLLVRIDIEWPETIGVTAQLNLDNGRYLETIRPTSRFAASQVTRRIRISDPLRMAAVTFDRRSAQEITVLPRRHEAGAAPMPWRYDRGDLLGVVDTLNGF